MKDFDVLFYSSPQPMWIFDVKTLYILEVNNAAIAYYGFTKDEFLSKTIIDLRPAEDIPKLIKYLPTIQSSATNFKEFRHADKSGRSFYVEIMSYPIVYNGVNARLVTSQNIEEKKNMLGKLEFTQNKLDKILESTSVGFFQVDHHSDITYWNRAAEMMIGYNREYLLGKNLWEVFTEAVGSDFYVQYHKAVRKQINIDFTSYFWPVQKWFSVSIYPVVNGMIIHFRDITENKLYEEKLLEKIEKLKEVSYLNSHYIRKPVASLLGLTNLIATEVVNENDFKKIAAHIRECSMELDKTLKQINTKVNNDLFADYAYAAVENFSLTGLIENIINESHQQQQTHKIILNSNGEINLFGSKSGIEQAIKCLVNNAIKFSPETDIVDVRVENIAQNVVLSVKDYGVGIDRPMINKLFTAFNKKSAAQKLGSGLEKVSQIAHRHNGNVWVESKPGKGSVFSMHFPVSNIAAFKNSGSTDFSDYQPAGMKITYNNELKCVVADWSGFHSMHSAKAGCLKLLMAVMAHKSTMILNDNTNVMGTWDDAAEWIASEYFPMLQQANITHIAWVYSPSTFSRLSTDLTIENIISDVVIKSFDDKAKASEWLIQMR